MSIDRANILRGPGFITFDSASIHSEGNIEATLSKDLFDVATAAFSVVDRRVQNKMIEVSITPRMFSDMAKILPHADTEVGADIYGSADKPLVITPRSGQPLTIANAAVTGLPTITLSASRSAVGGMTFTGLIANDTDANALASYLSWGTAASDVAMTGFDLSKVRNAPYTASYNGTTFHSEEGFTLTPTLDTEDIVVDGLGVVGKQVTGVSMTASFTPVGIGEEALTTLLGFEEDMGAGVAKHDFEVSGGGLTFTLKNAMLRQAQYQYGNANRTGALEAVTSRTDTTGAVDALWTIAEA